MGHPPPRRRDTFRPSIHMWDFTHEDDIKIKNKYVAGTSRTTVYIYLLKPSTGLSHLGRLSLQTSAADPEPARNIFYKKFCSRNKKLNDMDFFNIKKALIYTFNVYKHNR
jgi:hypothetical protein